MNDIGGGQPVTLQKVLEPTTRFRWWTDHHNETPQLEQWHANRCAPYGGEWVAVPLVIDEKQTPADTGRRADSLADLEGRDFYEVCQRYRHARDGMPTGDGPTAAEAFEDLKTWIRENFLTAYLAGMSHEAPPMEKPL